MGKLPLFYVLESKHNAGSYWDRLTDAGVEHTPLPDAALPEYSYAAVPIYYSDCHPITELETILREPTSTPVYFIYSHFTDCIKIGQSLNPGERIKTLQTASAGRLTLLAVTTAYTEREMHEKFASERVSGEWFRPSGDLCGFIMGLR